MPKYLDMHGLETLTGDIENTYLKKNQKGAAGGVASLDSNGKVPASQIPGGAGGTSDYANLDNKPQINGNTLSGNKTTENLGIHDIPSGGTTGQVLAKHSGADHDVEWVTPEDSTKADVANPVFTGSISLGRVENSTVGEKSTATGTSVTASGPNSHAEGYGTTASGNSSHVEGSQTFAVGDYSHSQGYGTRANGDASSVEGNGTVANGANSSVSGMYNVPDSYANWPDWAPNTYYAAGAKVHLPDEEPDDPRGEYFVCNTSHTSGTAWITYSFYWDSDNGKMNYAQIVGNGSNYLQQSNAYTLDWDGNGSYAGDVTINKGTSEEVSVSELKTEINSRYTKPNTGIPASDLANGVIPTVHNVPAGGSPGQVLAKSSGTDYALEWANPVTPSDAQAETYISAWLDGHPEATTTVEDGSITKAKFNSSLASELDGKAPAIIVADDSAYNHDVGNSVMKSLSITGTSHPLGTAKISNMLNIAPASSADKSDSENNFTFTFNDYTGYINGTATNGHTMLVAINHAEKVIPAGDYKLLLYYDITGATASAWNKLHTTFTVKYTGQTSGTKLVNNYVSTIGSGLNTCSFTLENSTASIYLEFEIVAGSTYSNAVFYYGIFPADAVITDTEITLESGESATYSNLGSFTSGTLCTMQNKSVLTYIADTKGYVDALDVDINDKLTYVTPENPLFGAVGDGVTDDTTALNACIAYGITNNIPVRAFGVYKTTGTINISGNHSDIYIYKIISYSNISGITITGNRNRIEFVYIETAGNGIELANACSANKITGVYIIAKYAGIKFNPSEYMIIYNEFNITRISVSNGNGIEGPACTHDHTQTNPDINQQENYFYNTSMRCQNGWAIYNSPGRYYSIDMEVNVLNGIHVDGGMYTFVGCRYAELVNKCEDYDNNGGTLIKYIRGGIEFRGGRKIPYRAIDTSDVPNYSDMSTEVKHAQFWGGSVIDAPIAIGVGASMAYCLIGEKMLIVGKHKICVPRFNCVYTITSADFDMRDSQLTRVNGKPYPTRMVIGVADCVIHLSDSYCSQGYREFIVDQSDSTKLCTIYDARNSITPIFNGSTIGAGVYKLTANCDVMASGITYFYGNNGENDVWTVTKIS